MSTFNTSSPSVKSSTSPELDEFYRTYALNAFKVVLEEFPLKIKQIEELKSEFSWKQLDNLQCHTDWIGSFTRTHFRDDNRPPKVDPIKWFRAPSCCIAYDSNKPKLFDVYHNGRSSMIATNSTVHHMIERIKPYLLELSDLALQLTFAIQLLEPKFQEGNNFGVEVQSKAIAVSHETFQKAQEFLNNLKLYYKNRDKAQQSMMHYPHIEDYQASVAELDRAFAYQLCRGVDELYKAYTAIHDLVIKDIDKLLRPRDDTDGPSVVNKRLSQSSSPLSTGSQ